MAVAKRNLRHETTCGAMAHSPLDGIYLVCLHRRFSAENTSQVYSATSARGFSRASAKPTCSGTFLDAQGWPLFEYAVLAFFAARAFVTSSYAFYAAALV